MAFIAWQKDLETGIEKIDKQHMMLVGMINELYDGITNGKSMEKMSDVLTGLMHYAQTHFQTEEALFREKNYPETQQHIKEHNDFIIKVSGLFDKLNKGELVLSVDLSKFLRDWLIKHVMYSDMKYREYLRD